MKNMFFPILCRRKRGWRKREQKARNDISEVKVTKDRWWKQGNFFMIIFSTSVGKKMKNKKSRLAKLLNISKRA